MRTVKFCPKAGLVNAIRKAKYTCLAKEFSYRKTQSMLLIVDDKKTMVS